MDPALSEGEDSADYWLGRIHRLRNTRVEVPRDEVVRQGIRTRKAYGGSATRSSFAILCALMESEELQGEAPARGQLTIEHVMPQKLTETWKRVLGEGAEDIHGRYRHRLANLTLSGDATNSSMAADRFQKKREVYGKSTMRLTRRLADENEWNEDALERRAEDLSRRVLQRWPWSEPADDGERADEESPVLRWRLEGGPWRTEHAASQMVLNVAGALLSRAIENARRMAGETIRSNVHPASRYPPGGAVGALTLRGIPGHDRYVMYPYAQDYPASAQLCRRLGERCHVQVGCGVRSEQSDSDLFGVSSKRNGRRAWTEGDLAGGKPVDESRQRRGDRIGMYVGNPEQVRLYIRAGESQASEERGARMRGIHG